MEIKPSPAIPAIDAESLTTIVRRLLQRGTFQIHDWRASQLGGGVGNPVSAGLYRIEGSGQDGKERISWSVILKILQSPANVGWVDMGEGDYQGHWNYWKREYLLYQSGLLDTLPEDLTAARCYEAVELPGHVAWLWLEDIHDASEGAWSLERYALTARHLGRLNGTYSWARPLPDFPWLGRHLVRQWIDSGGYWTTIPWRHPRVLQRYPPPEANPFRHMLMENRRFLAKLELLPKTLCHGDTYPTNFKSRDATGGQQQTVALDWALAGIAPLGDDLGQLVLGAQTILKEARPEAVDRALFESYMDGLRESGCLVDPHWVRFGYSTSAALRVGLFQLFWLDRELKQNEPIPEQPVKQPVPPACFEVTMAAEAYELLDAL